MMSCKKCKNWNNGLGTDPCLKCNVDNYSNFEPFTALDSQEGGQHYKSKAIQPIVYIHANGLGFCEGNVVKYITRHKEKNGAEDIRKVIHYCELLLELEYKNEDL
jgi:hypothetical protein